MSPAPKWDFSELGPSDTIRNSIAGEFFSTEAVAGAAESLVREAIQNSLDARPKDSTGRPSGLAKVRIYLSEETGAATPEVANRWFASLWPHVDATGSGLRNQPLITEPMPFIVLEDFGTTGLTGDPTEHQPLEGQTNNFLNFFRADGYSDKGQHERGSWGVGKIVFNRSSRIRAFLGLTIRAESPERLLMGRCILKHHRVDRTTYKSDGYFGQRRPDGLVVPSQDDALLESLAADFHLARTKELGLSVVVPWPELTVTPDADGLGFENIALAIITGFFWPILLGHLQVRIESPARSLVFSYDTITADLTRSFVLAKDIAPSIRLAEWGRTLPEVEFLRLAAPPADRAQKWAPEILSDEHAAAVRSSLASRERLAIHVPLSIRRKSSDPTPTFFRIYLEHSDGDSERPCFVRDELIIADVDGRRASHVRAIVIVEDDPLAALLRDAETPAHTRWTPRTEHFKHTYTYGTAVINYVKSSVFEILRLAYMADSEPDLELAIDYFSIPAPQDSDGLPAPGIDPTPNRGSSGSDRPNIPPPQPPRFRVERVPGGFSVRRGAPTASTPHRLHLRVAYDVRKGNPLKHYHPADFDLRESPIAIAVLDDSASVTCPSPNAIDVLVRKPEFRIDVTGFDENRDLYVNPRVMDDPDDDQAH